MAEAPHLATYINGMKYHAPLIPLQPLKFRYSINSSTNFSTVTFVETGLTSSAQAHLLIEYDADPRDTSYTFVNFYDPDENHRGQIFKNSTNTKIVLKIMKPDAPGDGGQWLLREERECPCFWYFTDSTIPLKYFYKLRFSAVTNIYIHHFCISLW